jgi:GcrA cell cycle regulator
MQEASGEKPPMQIDWPPAHSEALRQYRARGMSYAEAAETINATFGTGYSRSAAIGRGKRLGLGDPGRRDKSPKLLRVIKPRLRSGHERRTSQPRRPMPILESVKTVNMPMKLRCVEIEPRYLSFIELECGDCRYPYGGDQEGDAITFCGHPRRDGSSYCTPHFHLTRGPSAASERAAGTVSLRLVAA